MYAQKKVALTKNANVNVAAEENTWQGRYARPKCSQLPLHKSSCPPLHTRMSKIEILGLFFYFSICVNRTARELDELFFSFSGAKLILHITLRLSIMSNFQIEF